MLGLIRAALRNRGIFYVGMGNLISSGLTIVFWLIIANFLKVGDYGYIGYSIALANLTGEFVLLGLNITVTTFVAKGENGNMVRDANFIVFIACISVCGFYLIIGLLYVSFLVLAFSVYLMSLAEALGRKKYEIYAFMLIGSRSCQLAFSLVFYYLWGFNGILIGSAIAWLLTGLHFFKNIIPLNFDFTSIKKNLAFILSAFGARVVESMALFFDRVLIGWLYGNTIVGFYVLALQFYFMLYMLPNMMFYYLLPEKSSGATMPELEKLSLLMAVFLAVGGFIFFPFFIGWLFPKFDESIQIVRLMSLAVIPATIANIKSAELFANDRSDMVFQGRFLGLCALIFGIVVFWELFDTIGLGVAILASQTALAIYFAYISKRLELELVVRIPITKKLLIWIISGEIIEVAEIQEMFAKLVKAPEMPKLPIISIEDIDIEGFRRKMRELLKP